MKIEVSEAGQIVLKEVYSSIILETREGNRIAICMRDDTFELSVLSAENPRWQRVDVKTGAVGTPAPAPIDVAALSKALSTASSGEFSHLYEFGWAPGGYTFKCKGGPDGYTFKCKGGPDGHAPTCERNESIGEKRARCCRACAKLAYLNKRTGAGDNKL